MRSPISPNTARTAAVALAAVAVVACVFVVIARSGGTPSASRSRALREAALVSLALVALVVQSSVWPSTGGNRARPLARKESFALESPEEAPPEEAPPEEASLTAVAPPPPPPARADALPSLDVIPELLTRLPSGVTTYATALNPLSYGTQQSSGRTWRNVAPASPATASCGTSDRDFHFRTTPAVSRPSGFALGENVLSGPQSHLLGLDGDQAMTVFLVFQLTGPSPTDPTTLFQLFANTSGGNGLSMSMSTSGKMLLQVGSAMPMECNESEVKLDASHRYLLAATKDRSAYRVSLVDLDAKGFSLHTLLHGVIDKPERVSLANVDMSINKEGRWNASLVAFGLVNRSLGDADFASLYEHYVATLREYDAEYQRLRKLTEAAEKAKSCPFDAATCTACGGVKDWSAASGSLFASGGITCLTSIHRYCSAHPGEARCSCWDTSNPEYAGNCAPYRALFSEAGRPKVVVVPPPVVAPPSCAPPPPPPSELSPASIDAITRLIKATAPQTSSCGRCGHSIGAGEKHECEVDNEKKKKSGCGKCGRKVEKGEKHECVQHVKKHDDQDRDSEDGEVKLGFWAWLFGGSGGG